MRKKKFARAERLGQVIVRAEFEAEHAVNLRRLRGEHDDGNFRRGRVEPQNLARLEAVHFRQHHVEHDQIRRLRVRLFERLRAIDGRADGVTRLFEVELDQFHRLRLVIHN